MNPNPFFSLNHFTVPLAIYVCYSFPGPWNPPYVQNFSHAGRGQTDARNNFVIKNEANFGPTRANCRGNYG